MLVASAAVAAACAWLADAYRRAHADAAFLTLIDSSTDSVQIKQVGPGWLDILGARWARRRITAAWLQAADDDGNVKKQMLGRLEQLRDLECLLLYVGELDPAIAESFRKMRQLRILGVDGLHGDNRDPKASEDCLNAISTLAHLEHLQMSSLSISGPSLSHLDGLINLKSLSLSSINISADRSPALLLAYLPPFAVLEALDLQNTAVTDSDMHYLTRLPRLKSINLHGTKVSDHGLAIVASLPSLEELTIGGPSMSPQVLLEPIREPNQPRASIRSAD